MARVPTLPTRVSISPSGRGATLPKVERYGSGRGGRPWRRTRDRILARDEGLCVPCNKAGRITMAREIDHIVPLSQGGHDNDFNLQSICIDCHAAKTASESRVG